MNKEDMPNNNLKHDWLKNHARELGNPRKFLISRREILFPENGQSWFCFLGSALEMKDAREALINDWCLPYHPKEGTSQDFRAGEYSAFCWNRSNNRLHTISYKNNVSISYLWKLTVNIFWIIFGISQHKWHHGTYKIWNYVLMTIFDPPNLINHWA